MKSLKWPESPNNLFYAISGKEEACLLMKGAGIMLLLDYCFYQSLTAFFLLLPAGYWFYRSEKRQLISKKRQEARWQFKEMLSLTVAGQKAGYSVENALLKSYGDLAGLYGEDSGICRMLREVKSGLDNRLPVTELLGKMGQDCSIEEIKEFAEVFAIAKESGGNMTSVMERTAETISNKAQTGREIETILSARRMEQKIMNIMPFFLIVYINLTSPGYFDGLYHSPSGTLIMTFCLFIYMGAYSMGVKTASVKI